MPGADCIGPWSGVYQSIKSDTTNVEPTPEPPLPEYEVQEQVTIEREFDEHGNVIKETRTVSKPKRIERDLEPRVKPVVPDRPLEEPQKPWTPPPGYPRPWTVPNAPTAPQQPYTQPWNPQPYWIGDPAPGTYPQVWCGTPPSQSTYTVTHFNHIS